MVFILRYFCRSLTYDPISKACVLSSEDSASLSDQEVATMTGTGYYYFEILCMALGKQTVTFIFYNFKLCRRVCRRFNASLERYESVLIISS